MAFMVQPGSTCRDPSGADTQAFLALLSRLCAGGACCEEERAAAALFDWQKEVAVSRAPGRLDVMGGIADYSGSLVLQLPIAEACFCCAQLGPGDGLLRVVSLGGGGERASEHTLPWSALLDKSGLPLSYEAARAVLGAEEATKWAAYPLGAVHVLSKEQWASGGSPCVASGLRLLLASAVPEGKGVSSSAAIEVATLSAYASLAHCVLDGRQTALYCQMAENLCVGAPCGVMDQMASALGRKGQLLSLLCRPAEVQGTVALPEHCVFWGIDSGVRHSVGGSDYGGVRCAAFMGRAMIRQMDGGAHSGLQHLTELTPSHFDGVLAPLLPDLMSGSIFVGLYGSHGDAVTSLSHASNDAYAVRNATAHPVHEHARVRTFAQLLLAPPSDEQLSLMGELMRQSHNSYGRCGLGSAGTDALVALVEELGPQRGLFGAKITGGGSGGTVCILGRPDAGDAIAEVAARYAAASGQTPYVFAGSSEGAAEFGVLRVRIGSATDAVTH